MHLGAVRRLGLLVALVVFAGLVGSAAAQGPQFCWKDSYGRGVGTVPDSCPRGQERIGLLCYDRCPSGMKRVGVDCHSVCPAGMEDQGLFCRRKEYGRGAGYPWKFGDSLNDSGMRRRCERDHGKGNCEKSGEIYYPKCKPGYKPFGCCICRPKPPDCRGLGLKPGIDLSCAKVVQVGNPKTGRCGSGEEKDAGLCYDRCQAGYDGIGPVCWADKPSGWVNCGMGAAKDPRTCAGIVFDQVSSVGQMAMFVGSLGTSSAGSAGANSAKLAQLKRKFEDMKRAWNQIRNSRKVRNAIEAAKAAGTIKQAYDISQEVNNATTEEDMVRVAAQIAAIADPTGFSATVGAYTYPVCSKYFADQGRPGSSPPPRDQPVAPPPRDRPATPPPRQPPPQSAPQRSLSPDDVDGRNVVRADHARGRFEQTSNGVWTEFDANGRGNFTFRETGRDAWSVYMNDRSRNVQIQIDIHRKMIRYGTGNGPKQDLYPITRSWRVGTSSPSLSQSGVNGRNVVRADHAQGRFEQTQPGVWKEFGADARANFTFRETGRDDWSVYMNDRGRNVQIQIDIHRKMIRYGTNNGPKQDLYRITSAWRR